jgi:hypothetical protein
MGAGEEDLGPLQGSEKAKDLYSSTFSSSSSMVVGKGGDPEMVRRLLSLIPLLCGTPYLGRNGAIMGSTGLYLVMGGDARDPTDIDMADSQLEGGMFKERISTIADEVRPVAEAAGYSLKMNMARRSGLRFCYSDQHNKNGKIKVDLSMNGRTHVLEPEVKCYEGIGDVRLVRLEEMLASKIAMLSRPGLRGDKRYSDMLDIYASIGLDVDQDLLRKSFVYVMSELGITIGRSKMRDMLMWHKPSKFNAGVERVFGESIDCEAIKSEIERRYRGLCQLTTEERAYNGDRVSGSFGNKVPIGEDPLHYLMAEKREFLVESLA